MSRITGCLEKLKGEGRQALIPYFMAGDPDPGLTVPLMHAVVTAGADIIELGVPFSDPMADGPVIQRAAERALTHQVSLKDVMAMVADFRRDDTQTPVVLMGYLNPIEVMGYSVFAELAGQAGVDGALTVDLPPEEAGELVAALKQQKIDPIFLLAPTSDDARIRTICEVAAGYVYYVAVKGVTGSARLDVQSVADKLDQIRQHTDIPIGVGFGIKDATSAAAISNIADAVVVGSALVQKVEDAQKDEQEADQQDRIITAISDILAQMRTAMDSPSD